MWARRQLVAAGALSAPLRTECTNEQWRIFNEQQTKPYEVSRAELATKEAEVDGLIAEVGANKRGKTIVRCSLSSKPKQVGGTVHPEAGVPEFVSKLLSTLDPVDALTFLRQDGLLSLAFGAGRKRRRPEPEQE